MKGWTPYKFKNNKLYLGLFKKEIHWHCFSPTPPPHPHLLETPAQVRESFINSNDVH